MLLLAAASLLASTHPLDGQRVLLRGALPCVRLLNRTGRIGCATPSRAVIAPLIVATDARELSALLEQPPEGELAVALSAALFEPTSLHALTRAFGAALQGILVLHAASIPHGAPSPAPASPWLTAGSGLALERFPFAIALLTEAESATVLAHASPRTSAAASPPLIELRYPMMAREDAPRCLAAGSCLPVGGQSVWGSLRPRTAANATAPESTLLPPDRPVVGLAAAMDASSFFHDAAPGAYAAVSSVVALLAAVDAIVGAEALFAQLPSLHSSPVFFLFTAEAWEESGSRRFLTDVNKFSCRDDAAAASQSTCDEPYKPDLTFAQLRASGLRSLVHVGPVGAAAGNAELFVHSPAGASGGDEVAAAIRGAAAASMPVRDGTAGRGLPPGPARSFADPKLALRRRGIAEGGAATEVATLADFDQSYRGEAVVGSRFDTADGLDASRVCAAAGVAARAWWTLAGGVGSPEADCLRVKQLLDCLLPSPTNSSRKADAKSAALESLEAADERDDDEPELAAAQSEYEATCPLAAELGIDRRSMATRYTGVFQAERGRVVYSATALFAKAWLERSLNATCDGRSTAEGLWCEPAVMLHDAYSPGIERDASGVWRVSDATEPIWAESNWPAEMYARLYPHGAPPVGESLLLLGVGALGALLTYGSVVLSKRTFKEAYKQI